MKRRKLARARGKIFRLSTRTSNKLGQTLSGVLDRLLLRCKTARILNIVQSERLQWVFFLQSCLSRKNGILKKWLFTLFIQLLYPSTVTFKLGLSLELSLCFLLTPARFLFQVQLQLFSVFATDLATGTGCAAHLRHDVGVSRLMYMLKTFYWLHDAAELPQGEGSDCRTTAAVL